MLSMRIEHLIIVIISVANRDAANRVYRDEDKEGSIGSGEPAISRRNISMPSNPRLNANAASVSDSTELSSGPRIIHIRPAVIFRSSCVPPVPEAPQFGKRPSARL
jgi:hypothetical protein